MKIFRMLMLILILLALAGCAPSANEKSSDLHSTDPVVMPSNESSPSLVRNPPQPDNTLETLDMTAVSPDKDELIDLARQDLADRLKIGMDQISLLKTMEITWTDISKGCSPGTDTILSKGSVTGYRLWLQAQSEEYIYHVGLNGQTVLCPKVIPGANNPLLMTPNGSAFPPQDQSP